MKANILDLSGKKSKEIELPSFFSSAVREDILSKVLETKKKKQPYSPSPVAGKQHAAKGKVVHRRHVWRSGYGRGSSRVPRKIFSRRGSQFNWEAAEVPFARGGMRAHPPKVIAMISTLKINKKEIKIALVSAISATANSKKIAEKYSNLDEKSLTNVPLIVKSDLVSLKTKELLSSLKKILGEILFEIAIQKKTVRSGKGKLRGRKYKKTAGLLLVVANDETLKTTAFDVKKVKDLSVIDLAKGGSGRLTMYTEKSIKDLEAKVKGKLKMAKEKIIKTEKVKVAEKKVKSVKEKKAIVVKEKKPEKINVEKTKSLPVKTTSKKNFLAINPLVSEKAVMMIESQNILTFEADKDATKEEIKKEIEELFNVKVDKIRTLNSKNKKHAYVKLNKKFPAIDLATKLGMM